MSVLKQKFETYRRKILKKIAHLDQLLVEVIVCMSSKVTFLELTTAIFKSEVFGSPDFT